MKELAQLNSHLADLINFAQVSATTSLEGQAAADALTVAMAREDGDYGEEYLGWTQGNASGKEVEIFFDFMCPGSKAALMEVDGDKSIFDAFKNGLFDDGTSLIDAVNLKLVPFPIDMHKHVHEVGQVYFYMKHICKTTGQCQLNEYLEFAFAANDDFGKRSDWDDENFDKWWAGEVADKFDLDENEIMRVFKADDELGTYDFVEDLFWYGDAKDFEHVPALFIDGVLFQGDFPCTTDEWVQLLAQ